VHYKISLNTRDPSHLPWRVIGEDGKSQYFSEIIFQSRAYTVAESDTCDPQVNHGWLVCDGLLLINTNGMRATFISRGSDEN
jgi:hypothetical protein